MGWARDGFRREGCTSRRRCLRRSRTSSPNRNGTRARRAASGALLVGRLFDDRGNRMTPSTAKRASIRYRYYVSAVLAQGRQSEAGSVARASANKVEALVLEALRAAYPSDAELRG